MGHATRPGSFPLRHCHFDFFSPQQLIWFNCFSDLTLHWQKHNFEPFYSHLATSSAFVGHERGQMDHVMDQSSLRSVWSCSLSLPPSCISLPCCGWIPSVIKSDEISPSLTLAIREDVHNNKMILLQLGKQASPNKLKSFGWKLCHSFSPGLPLTPLWCGDFWLSRQLWC